MRKLALEGTINLSQEVMMIMMMIEAYVARNHSSVPLKESYLVLCITLRSVVDRNQRFEITCHYRIQKVSTEVAGSSETLRRVYQNTRRHIS
jgi:hypothetical protein